MLDSATLPVTIPVCDTPPSTERTGLRLLAFDVAASAIVAGDLGAALRLIGDAR